MNICGGFQAGITDKWSVRGAIHIPHMPGGIGIRLGTQYSFFDTSSFLNLAIGTDLGWIKSIDSMGFFGLNKHAIEKESNAAINADFFLPINLRFSSKSRIIFTARYRFNRIYIRRNIHKKTSTKFNPHLATLAVGL